MVQAESQEKDYFHLVFELMKKFHSINKFQENFLQAIFLVYVCIFNFGKNCCF